MWEFFFLETTERDTQSGIECLNLEMLPPQCRITEPKRAMLARILICIKTNYTQYLHVTEQRCFSFIE